MDEYRPVSVCVRVKPTSAFAPEIEIGGDGIVVRNPEAGDPLIVGHRPEAHAFRFDHVFVDSSQDDVYNTAARPVVDTFLAGTNGCILTYGQTGSGKTHTMLGDVLNFRNRGIAPRAIAQTFAALAARPELDAAIAVSYCEIYNDRITDLLARSRFADSMRAPGATAAAVGGGASDDLVIVDDAVAGVVVRGLTLVPVSNEEEALAALFAGETCRATAPHVLNTCSNRGHVVFTIHMRTRSRLSTTRDSIRIVKLNLVDLAGSERLKKTLGGTAPDSSLARESMAINKSLSTLEQCIVALAKAAAAASQALPGSSAAAAAASSHIPYRSSKLTALLRDSLGGVCATTLIACVWGESRHVEETTSTLRFAARMTGVSTAMGEAPAVVDKDEMIARQHREIQLLRQELAMHDAMAAERASGGPATGAAATGAGAVASGRSPSPAAGGSPAAAGGGGAASVAGSPAASSAATSASGGANAAVIYGDYTPEQTAALAERLKAYVATAAAGGGGASDYFRPIESVSQAREAIRILRGMVVAAGVEAEERLRSAYTLVPKATPASSAAGGAGDRSGSAASSRPGTAASASDAVGGVGRVDSATSGVALGMTHAGDRPPTSATTTSAGSSLARTASWRHGALTPPPVVATAVPPASGVDGAVGGGGAIGLVDSPTHAHVAAHRPATPLAASAASLMHATGTGGDAGGDFGAAGGDTLLLGSSLSHLTPAERSAAWRAFKDPAHRGPGALLYADVAAARAHAADAKRGVVAATKALNACKGTIDAITAQLTSVTNVGLSPEARAALATRLTDTKAAYRMQHGALQQAQATLAAAEASLDARTTAVLRAFEAWHAASSTFTHPAMRPTSAGALAAAAAGASSPGGHLAFNSSARLPGPLYGVTSTSPAAGTLSPGTGGYSRAPLGGTGALGSPLSPGLDEAEAFDRLERDRVAAVDPDSLAYFSAGRGARQQASKARAGVASPTRGGGGYGASGTLGRSVTFSPSTGTSTMRGYR